MDIRRYNTTYPGVFYRKVKRIGGNGLERVYYVIFKKDGKFHEEKVGRQYADDMTPSRAARFRAARIENRQKSRKEIRDWLEKQYQSKSDRWTLNRIWEEYKKTKSIKGLIQDENRYQKHLRETFGSKVPKELTPLDFDHLRIRLSKDLKTSTVRHVLELMRRIINFADKRKLCGVPDFKIELPPVNNHKTEDLTSQQLTRLMTAIEQASNRTAASMMKLALFTGMRRGEMFRLRWSDIDSNRGFIILRDPKGGKNQRIPLSRTAFEILESQPQTSEYVFPGRNGKQRTDISKEVNRIKAAAGLPKDFRALHGLRHVFASMLASSGKVDMYTLQKLLTHKSPHMTQRYAHMRDEALKKASEFACDLITADTKYGHLIYPKLNCSEKEKNRSDFQSNIIEEE